MLSPTKYFSQPLSLVRVCVNAHPVTLQIVATCPIYRYISFKIPIRLFKRGSSHYSTIRQPDAIELPIHWIPAAITDITTVNGQSISLSPGIVQLSAPIHAKRIIISWLHFLFLVDVGLLRKIHLSCKNFASSLAESKVLTIAHRVTRIDIRVWLRGHRNSWVSILLRLVHGLRLGLVDRLWSGNIWLLIEDRLWRWVDLEINC